MGPLDDKVLLLDPRGVFSLLSRQIDDGSVGVGHGLLVERCRFLEAAGCASICMNTCKASNKKFFCHEYECVLPFDPPPPTALSFQLVLHAGVFLADTCKANSYFANMSSLCAPPPQQLCAVNLCCRISFLFLKCVPSPRAARPLVARHVGNVVAFFSAQGT